MPTLNSKLSIYLQNLRSALHVLSAVEAQTKSVLLVLQDQVLDCDTIVSALPADLVEHLEALSEDMMFMAEQAIPGLKDDLKVIEESITKLTKETGSTSSAVLITIFEKAPAKLDTTS